MLELSHEEISFQWKQMKKSLMLTNNSESSIIFKVKTNVLNLIVATPSKGYIQPKKTVTIQIKCEKLQAFQAKLQVIYNVFLQMKSSIDQTWKTLNQSQLKTNMVYLSKEQGSNKEQEKSEKYIKEERQNQSTLKFNQESMSMHSSMSQSVFQSQNNLKVNQTNVYETKKQTLKMIQSITTPISQKSQKQQSKRFIKKTKICQVNSMEQDANRFEQQVLQEEMMKRSKNTVVSQNQNNFNNRNTANNNRTLTSFNSVVQNGSVNNYAYMNHSQLVKFATIQQQLLKQKQINQKLSQRLVKTNQLNRERYQYQMQSRINNSMQACPEDHFSFCTILVVCVIFFMVGFLIAKF